MLLVLQPLPRHTAILLRTPNLALMQTTPIMMPLSMYSFNIQSKCVKAKQKVIESCSSAAIIWGMLKKRHEQLGPLVQITLIQEAFKVYYSSYIPFSNTTQIFLMI